MIGGTGRARLFAAGSVLVIVAVVLWATLREPPSRPATPAPEPSNAVLPERSHPAPEPGAATTGAVADAPAPSLRGTDVDGGLTTDATGHFVPDPDAIALFDYFLAASGEEPESVIRQRILDEIRRRLSGQAAAAAAALLDDYLAYRTELRKLAQSAEVPGDLERRLQWIRELRRGHFGDETAEALFGAEERVVRIDLERRRVASDPGLDADERAARLAALDAELPEPVRRARERSRAPQRSHEEVAALRGEGASEQEIFAARERRFGWEAAERLAALDAQRAEWSQRLGVYEAERNALLASEEFASLPADQRDAELESLRRAHFDASEANRVEAQERFGR